MNLAFDYHTVFDLRPGGGLEEMALRVFRYQYGKNPVYKGFSDYLGIDPGKVDQISKIPFLPISFFKTHKVINDGQASATTFYSSGTTGSVNSHHHVADLTIYDQSILRGFEYAFGPVEDFSFFALLPSYHQNRNSSLLYMMDLLINASKNKGGFYLENTDELIADIAVQKKTKKVLLMGVSYALLDLAEKKPDLHDVMVLETGGMKGRRKEMTKKELHTVLNTGFQTTAIGSEYGMTELLSQAWSKGNGIFSTPPWMKILTRDTTDPLQYVEGRTGGINVIDLANIHSCSFIATQDLGLVKGNEFEIIGRFDHSDIRGCNLLVG